MDTRDERNELALCKYGLSWARHFGYVHEEMH